MEKTKPRLNQDKKIIKTKSICSVEEDGQQTVMKTSYEVTQGGQDKDLSFVLWAKVRYILSPSYKFRPDRTVRNYKSVLLLKQHLHLNSIPIRHDGINNMFNYEHY